jgi:hypothetical protein
MVVVGEPRRQAFLNHSLFIFLFSFFFYFTRGLCPEHRTPNTER